MASTHKDNEVGVYELITELCNRTANKYITQIRVSPKRLSIKMRTHAYEIILKKQSHETQCSKEPIIDLLTYYLNAHRTVKNVAEYRRSVELKKIISRIRQADYGEQKDHIYKVLKMLVALSDSVKEDHSKELFQKPFSFGMLDEMLPKPQREVFGSPQPYPFFPSHVFELPYSLKSKAQNLENHKSHTYSEYAVDSFDSKSFLPELTFPGGVEIKTVLSPMSIPSLTSTTPSLYPYLPTSTANFPRLSVPRDIAIPHDSSPSLEPNVKVTTPSEANIVEEVFRAKPNKESVDIWDIAAQIDQNVPEDIWEIASKMPFVLERQLIASSSREMALWRRALCGRLRDLSVVSERHFIRNVMYLIIGIETKSFPYNEESKCFYMTENLVLEGISKEHLKGYVSDLLLVGTYYRRLFKFAFNQGLEDHFHEKGLVYEAAREVMRRYLLKFRLKATELYEECSKPGKEDVNCIPTLLQILYQMEPLKYEMETVVSIYKLIDADSKSTIPLGAELMSYLFNEISMVTHKKTAHILFNSLLSICKVYFKFIERFIFEGELDDKYNEFFIRKDASYVNTRSKRYWDKGFHITQSLAVPEFLRPLAKFILLCGKSFRLLKHCNPSDPLVLLISSDHPSVVCCARFPALARAQAALDVHRTRCLFVSGAPVTFDQILLKREAERKAFEEMASIKQAETMEKIVAERKRLAQLIIAEKQHSLRVLEAAMRESREARQARRRGRARGEAAGAAKEAVDSRIRDDERSKIMEYYSKLNQQVEKSKIHTEWKIRRLQLDESRIQLLSTEERNLKREKLELEHKRNEEIMAMSIQSLDSKSDDDQDGHFETEEKKPDQENKQTETNAPKEKTSALSALYNAAKSIFIGTKTEDKSVDNKKELDAQGNIVAVDAENNTHIKESQISSDVIGANLNYAYDNRQFLRAREEAIKNKQKVLAHEFGQLDEENNRHKYPMISIDEDNNVDDSAFGEARRNRIKSLYVGFATPSDDHKQAVEPITDAQKEALVNKRKVMGVEYNLPLESTPRIDPANQTEALANRRKVMGVEYNLPLESTPRIDPANQTEALANKRKVMGVEYNLPLESTPRIDPANQTEALANKRKVMGVEYNLPLAPTPRIDPANQTEALANKRKVMGVEYNLPLESAPRNDPANQKEALANKRKVMGAEYNLPLESTPRNDPANIAQEEAVRNKVRILGSNDVKPVACDSKHGSAKRAGLTLSLKTYNDLATNDPALNSGAVTPGDLLPTLELETPTTADIPLESALTAEVFTPHSEGNKLEADIEAENEKPYLRSDGFDFSLIDETVDAAIEDTQTTPISSPSKSTGNDFSKLKLSVINFLDGSYSLENFDPFGVKDMKRFTKDYFNSKMDLAMASSCYTHPSITMEEVKKKPYTNIFSSHFEHDEEDTDTISTDNIATLTACLQRSVMLPLTYQLEVVNNSILTYFLVNLDMYEHMKSLKDYFFLMDGEFSKSICQNLFTRLGKTLNPQELLNFVTLHNILDKALGSSISHVHKFSENLSFTITESPLSFQHSSPDVLSCLSLTYAVSWPLNIILSQEALLRYARVFQFLIKMRRIFWVLSEDFEVLKLAVKLSNQHSRKLIKSPHYTTIQVYRHIMMSMIRALDNYIVSTCILSSWKEFENDLKKARTLDDLYECHVVYIKKVLFRCLLNNRSMPVMKLLNDIFTVILKFSRVLKAGEWQQKEPNGFFTHSNFSQLQELYNLFEKLGKYLHKVVTKLMECGYQRHLAELLSMVNLNGYYDLNKSKEQQNVSVQST